MKLGILLIVWILFTGILMSKNEKVLTFRQLSIPIEQIKSK